MHGKIIKNFVALFYFNPDVHFLVHNCQQRFPVLRQIDFVHPLPSFSLSRFLILFCLLLLGLPTGYFLYSFLNKSLYAFLVTPYACHMFNPSHPSSFDNPNNIWRRLQILRLIIMKFSPVSVYVLTLGPDCLPQYLLLKHTQPIYFTVSPCILIHWISHTN